jgi:hypothetical protein
LHGAHMWIHPQGVFIETNNGGFSPLRHTPLLSVGIHTLDVSPSVARQLLLTTAGLLP